MLIIVDKQSSHIYIYELMTTELVVTKMLRGYEKLINNQVIYGCLRRTQRYACIDIYVYLHSSFCVYKHISMYLFWFKCIYIYIRQFASIH